MSQYLISGVKFCVIILGCRVNHYEGEALASMLEARGAEYVKSPEEGAGIIIVVTCSLTSTADAHARKTLRRLRRENGQAVIAACGCHAQCAKTDDLRSLEVNVLAGNGFKHRIPDALERFLADGNFIEIRESADGLRRHDGNPEWDDLFLDRPRLHTRAFVKVQDGCDMRCSYCAVPNLRGPQISRKPSMIVEEISSIIDSGCREVVLTGIHLGSYRSGETTLAGLVREISEIPGLSRLRFGSLEPFAASDDLLLALSCSSVFCPHLHLPLESGDDGVLRDMRRGYDSSGFARRLDSVRRFLGDDVHISTDVMVGFPGESDEAFENSVRFLERFSFGRVHVFPFSPREGTRAASMPGAIPRHVVRERVRTVIGVSERLLSSYAERFVGRECRVVIEDGAAGWNRHYVRVFSDVRQRGSEWRELSLIPDRQAGGILLCPGVRLGDVCDTPEDF
ncbi:MAG: MiaB/RimO family radical SAM methylthiotransferase [Synergistaceae bacterium]|jgi:threonylcarbamoyladenosine tRNA methylthiotransferase MtaB|nr:MiaB/RimO family radical SAM methylthiotransferase [Synergistaceae bacterium]